MNWRIKNMKRTIDDGLVIEVVFEIIAKDQQLIASKLDKLTWLVTHCHPILFLLKT